MEKLIKHVHVLQKDKELMIPEKKTSTKGITIGTTYLFPTITNLLMEK